MKQLSFIIGCLLSTFTFGQTTWSTEYDVSGAGSNLVRPRIALTTNNEPIVMWGNSHPDSNIVYTARWNGNGFGAPVRIHSLSTMLFTSYWAGPEIAASGDTVFIGVKVMPEYDHGVYSIRSVDGGLTYEDTVRIDPSVDSITRYPTVAIAAGGSPVYAYMKWDTNMLDPQYYVANSPDGGLSFNQSVIGSELAPEEVCDCCPAHILVQGDRQVLLFRNNDNDLRETWASVSENGGATFESSGRIDTSGWEKIECPSSGPDGVLFGDQLTAVHMSVHLPSPRTRVNTSETDISNFDMNFYSMMDTWDTITVSSNYPRMAGADGTVGAVWQHTEWGNVNIYFSASSSGAAYLVDNIDTVNIYTDGNQRAPDIAYADGTFHIVWLSSDSGSVIYRTVSGSFDAVEERFEGELRSSVIPNPFAETTTITFDNPQMERYGLRIYDIAGRLQSEMWTSTGTVVVSANMLRSGTYFYVLTGPSNDARGKLMVY